MITQLNYKHPRNYYYQKYPGGENSKILVISVTRIISYGNSSGGLAFHVGTCVLDFGWMVYTLWVPGWLILDILV